MSATLALALGSLGAAAVFVTLVRVRHPTFLTPAIMMTSWLTGEYPLFWAVCEGLAAVILIIFGALDQLRGVIGIALVGVSWLGLVAVRLVTGRARPTSEAALREGLGDDYLDRLDPARRRRLRHRVVGRETRRPLHFDPTGIERHLDLSYGPHLERNLLDVYAPAAGAHGAPVIMQIHGGAWIIGHKQQQGLPLLYRLARSGYVGVSINYRLSPKARFPDHIIDVKSAIAWVKANIASHGGDPDTIIITGGSAGGHLASLAALTPNKPAWQPGFEDADTSVAACVPFYAPPDFRDRLGVRGRLASMEPLLTRLVMPSTQAADPDLWESVSPIALVHPDAPPFFVIQGANDVLVWREEARAFVDALRRTSRQPVVYWEVPGAQHAFDVFNSRRSHVAVDAVERFVGWVGATRTRPADGPDPIERTAADPETGEDRPR